MMRDQDLVPRLPIAASLPPGTPISRYFRNLNVEDFMRNSLDNSNAEIDFDDPAFTMFTDERGPISKDELIVRHQKIVPSVENTNDVVEEIQENGAREAASPDEARESEDHCGQNVDGLPTPCQSQESEEERQAREQEERLAALGVTGFAKPVRMSVLRSIVSSNPACQDDQETIIGPDSAPGLSAEYIHPIPFEERWLTFNIALLF